MNNQTTITIVGNLTADPELGFTTTGPAYARFVIASTPRRFDRDTDSYTDGETLIMRCTAWRDLAEHTTESLTKGVRVIATGRLRQNNWTDTDGAARWSIDLDVDDIGPSLQWATTTITKATRNADRPDRAGEVPAGADLNSAPTGCRAEPVPAGASTSDTPPF